MFRLAFPQEVAMKGQGHQSAEEYATMRKELAEKGPGSHMHALPSSSKDPPTPAVRKRPAASTLLDPERKNLLEVDDDDDDAAKDEEVDPDPDNVSVASKRTKKAKTLLDISLKSVNAQVSSTSKLRAEASLVCKKLARAHALRVQVVCFVTF